jgi:hypothetical protein
LNASGGEPATSFVAKERWVCIGSSREVGFEGLSCGNAKQDQALLVSFTDDSCRLILQV